MLFILLSFPVAKIFKSKGIPEQFTIQK